MYIVKAKKSFTLVEVLVAIFILTITLTVVVSSVGTAVKIFQDNEREDLAVSQMIRVRDYLKNPNRILVGTQTMDTTTLNTDLLDRGMFFYLPYANTSNPNPILLQANPAIATGNNTLNIAYLTNNCIAGNANLSKLKINYSGTNNSAFITCVWVYIRKISQISNKYCYAVYAISPKSNGTLFMEYLNGIRIGSIEASQSASYINPVEPNTSTAIDTKVCNLTSY